MKLANLTNTQRRALVGDDDAPGLLDEYKITVTRGMSGRSLIVWHCPREHGDEGTGHVGIIARDMDGDQSGLTLGELVDAALDHEEEGH